MEFTRNISKGTSGNDVFYIKKKLFELGMYEPKIKKISSKTFRNDSVLATKKFQTKYKLPVTGIINRATWDAIVKKADEIPEDTVILDPTPEPEPVKPQPAPPVSSTNYLTNYTWIDPKKRKLIEADLAKVSEMRRNICLEILKYAFDPEYRSGEVRALYMWAENMYNSSLNLNYATKAKIESGAKKYPQYYDGGRKEWMLKQVERCTTLPCSDCSGMEVGWLRKFKLVSNKFDRNSTALASTSCSIKTTREAALPGTFIHRPGHIGTYVGGGYVVEFVGGAYGCQLTNCANGKRKVWNFIDKKLHKFSDWEDFWNFKELLKYD
jgi:hypothetical protein